MTTVDVQARGTVLVVTLNRPHVLNAVDVDLARELGEAIERLERDPDIRVGVITGAGTAFCAGLDMKAVAGGQAIEATRHPVWGFAGITGRRLAKPLVAAVNGAAIGGGLEIALVSDVIVVADHAVLGLPEVRHGVFAAGGGALRLFRQLPERIARELMLTARTMTAAEALSWGLVNVVVPGPEVLDRALRIAADIAGHAPLAVAATKRVLDEAGGLDPADPRAIAIVDAEAERIFATADALEGISAFAQSRQPHFTGR